jgi:hypothetical protein
VGVDAVMKASAFKKSLDNLTVVMVAFEGLKRFVEDEKCPSSI